MRPEMILRADILDILFDQRNKEYGAYELRRHYARRLGQALGTVFSALIVLIAAGYLLSSFGHSRIAKTLAGLTDTVTLTTVELAVPGLPAVHALPHPLVSTIIHSVPRIVRDPIVKDPLPTVEEMNISQIGPENKPGAHAGDLPQPSGANGSGGTSQPQVDRPDNEILIGAEVMPEFPGGTAALEKFLARNLKMPREDLEDGSKILSQVRFVVDRDGRVTGLEVEKSAGRDFDEEVMRVIRKMPLWKPGIQNGRTVAVYFTLPVIFRAPDEN